jgi:hypothetical protein
MATTPDLPVETPVAEPVVALQMIVYGNSRTAAPDSIIPPVDGEPDQVLSIEDRAALLAVNAVRDLSDDERLAYDAARAAIGG